MVQWLSMFEDTKVYAAMPFWDIADNYSDTAVQNNTPNGQWWLLYWYGQLTGHTVDVTVPQPGTIDTAGGLAALDTSKHQARIIVSDPSGGSDQVKITGIDPGLFGNRVHVSIQQATWTGYDGAQQILRVDSGSWSFVNYPPTLNWLFRSHQDMYLNLTAGSHTITLGTADPSIGTAKGQVTLDDIQLTYAPGQIPGITGPATSYPAAYADTTSGTPTFAVDAGQDGYYRVGGTIRDRVRA